MNNTAKMTDFNQQLGSLGLQPGRAPQVSADVVHPLETTALGDDGHEAPEGKPTPTSAGGGGGSAVSRVWGKASGLWKNKLVLGAAVAALCFIVLGMTRPAFMHKTSSDAEGFEIPKFNWIGVLALSLLIGGACVALPMMLRRFL